MPRLTSLTDKLVTSGSKRSPVYLKTYTGTDFSYVHSTWTFNISTVTTTGTVTLTTNGLPYHKYGNAENPYSIVTQSTNTTWLLRAGTNLGPIISTATVTTTTGSGTSTQVTTSTVTGPFPTPVSTNTTIGYWLNGVSMYSASAGTEAPNGYITFNNLNYVSAYDADRFYNFYLGQDNSGALWAEDGVYHYNNFNFDYAWLNGAGIPNNYTIPRQSTAPTSPEINDLWYNISVSTLKIWDGVAWVNAGPGEASLISYLGGSLTHSDGHSKILGWSLDGYPVYGPYGYEQPLDNNSRVRAMVSGYTLYDNINKVKARITDGATDTFAYPFGIFIQDYYYAGTGDLDRSNGRYCVTPDYPAGTYAYFATFNTSTGRTSYPYVIGDYFKSTPQVANTTTIYTNTGTIAPKQTS
jgi:hypothetical protein